MKSYIENELKSLNGTKFQKNYNTTKESNRGPIGLRQATAVPVSQLAIRWQGCKALI